ncbi:outer membrane protein assembly factor [candidate division CSSED10-310 bacterium]|uniref:Outer membrane protein assembly factor n=1 Tax=candidate division CSSED10-310 bacterium TaxID=2855610 RepID=A0ABV6YUN8_UNCC1
MLRKQIKFYGYGLKAGVTIFFLLVTLICMPSLSRADESAGDDLALPVEKTYKVKKLTFSGQKMLSRDLLAFMVKVKPKFKASQAEVVRDAERLMKTGLFQKVDFQFQKIDSKVAIRFQVVEKTPLPVYTIIKKSVDGNSKTKDKVIIREIELLPGQILDWDLLWQGLLELEKLRIFKRVDFRLSFGPEPESISQVELIIEVIEGLMQVGFIWPTYSSDNPDLGGFGPLGGYVNINFLGTGSWIGFGGMWAKNRVILGGMNIPRLWGTRQYAMFGLGYGEREQESYDEHFHKTGGEFSINVGGFVGYWNIPLQNNLKMLNVLAILETTFDQIQGEVPSEDAWTTLYSTTLAYDSRDDDLETTSGWYPGLRLDVGYYTGESGKEASYFRFNPTLKRYFRLGHRQCLAVQVRGGVTNKNIPYLGKYQLGGSNDLRGFPEWSLVGNNYFLTNLEYRFPIISIRSNYGISGVLFVDAGQAWDPGGDDPFDRIHVSEGVGLRFLAGPMILRLDYGFSEYTDGVYFYFNHLF